MIEKILNNNGNDCDTCENSYIYNGDCWGCKCKYEERDCEFVEVEDD